MINILFTFFEKKLAHEAFERNLRRIPVSMQLRIRKYRWWQDAHCGLFGKMLLIEGLKKYGLGEGALKDIQYTQYNRPYLNEAIDFNISHSGNGVVCAIGRDCRVGIDIEEVKPIDIQDFKKQFTEQELSLMYNSEDTYQEFYKWWTKKEAIIKADGQGLGIPLKKINFQDPGRAEVKGQSWHIREIPLHGQYCCHLAFEGEGDMQVKTERYNMQ